MNSNNTDIKVFSYTNETELKNIEVLKNSALYRAGKIKKAFNEFDNETPFTNEILQSLYSDRGTAIIAQYAKKIEDYVNAQILHVRPSLQQTIYPEFNKKCNALKTELQLIIGDHTQDNELIKYENDFIINQSKIDELTESANKYIQNQYDLELFECVKAIADVMKQNEVVLNRFKKYMPLNDLLRWINKDDFQVEKFEGVDARFKAFNKMNNK